MRRQLFRYACLFLLLAQSGGIAPETLRWWTPKELAAFRGRCEGSGGRVLAFDGEPRSHMQMLVCQRGAPGNETWERDIRWGPPPDLFEQEKRGGGFQ